MKILNLKRTTYHFDEMTKDKKALNRVHFMSVSQIWVGRKFYIVEDADTRPTITDVVVVKNFGMKGDNIFIEVQTLYDGKTYELGYIPKAVHGILMSVPSKCIVSKQVIRTDTGGFEYRLCAGIMFKQFSNPANCRRAAAIVEDERMAETYGAEESDDMIEEFKREIS